MDYSGWAQIGVSVLVFCFVLGAAWGLIKSKLSELQASISLHNQMINDLRNEILIYKEKFGRIEESLRMLSKKIDVVMFSLSGKTLDIETIREILDNREEGDKR